MEDDETIETCGNLTAECISEGEVLYKNVDPDSTNVMYGSPTMIPSLILNKECALEPVQCKPIPPPSDNNEGEDGGKQCLNPQTLSLDIPIASTTLRNDFGFLEQKIRFVFNH